MFANHSTNQIPKRNDQTLKTGRQTQREERREAHLKIGRFWLQRLGLLVLLIAILASLLNALSLTSDAKVLPLSSGDSSLFLHDEATYQAAAKEVLASSIWNRNKITINTDKINQELLKQFPELSNVNVTLPLLAHRPIIYIETAQPALLLVSGSNTYLIDSSGKALITGSRLANFKAANLPLVQDQSGLQVKLGQQALSSQSVSFIQMVSAQLSAKHVSIASMTLPPAASELDVQIANQPYFVKFNLESDTARQQAGTFLATIANLQKQNVTPGKYIDVRVPGRAYYQ